MRRFFAGDGASPDEYYMVAFDIWHRGVEHFPLTGECMVFNLAAVHEVVSRTLLSAGSTEEMSAAVAQMEALCVLRSASDPARIGELRRVTATFSVATAARQGGIENKHWIDVEYPPSPPRVSLPQGVRADDVICRHNSRFAHTHGA
jgi:hypothetical protein